METLYTAKAEAVNGRAGHIKTTDTNAIDMALSKPGAGSGTNPEQLFACGYSACFGGALAHIAKTKDITIGDVTIKGDVSLNKDGEGFAISAVLDVYVDDVDHDTAKELADLAHAFCPYSKATRGNIDVKILVNGQ